MLWVDDRPEGNLFEIAALNKLQIEVLIARSNDEAMDPKLRETRAKLAKSAGALGEAVLPAELLGLLGKALSS